MYCTVGKRKIVKNQTDDIFIYIHIDDIGYDLIRFYNIVSSSISYTISNNLFIPNRVWLFHRAYY